MIFEWRQPTSTYFGYPLLLSTIYNTKVDLIIKKRKNYNIMKYNDEKNRFYLFSYFCFVF